MNEKSGVKRFIKCIPLIAVSFGLLMSFMLFCVMTDLVPQNRNIDKADVNATFEKDYEDLLEVAEYLIDLEDELVKIRKPYEPMSVGYGDKKDIDPEMKGEIRSLFRRGYMSITKRGSSVVFKRWERPFSHEFRAGFAFNFRETDWVDVDFRIHQRELAVDNWYYYEEDYNEYRVTH